MFSLSIFAGDQSMDGRARGRVDGDAQSLSLRRALPLERHQGRRFAQPRQRQARGKSRVHISKILYPLQVKPLSRHMNTKSVESYRLFKSLSKSESRLNRCLLLG